MVEQRMLIQKSSNGTQGSVPAVLHCDWLNKLCVSKLIKVSFISSYGVVIFKTCLQSLRLTPPLRVAETIFVTPLLQICENLYKIYPNMSTDYVKLNNLAHSCT